MNHRAYLAAHRFPGLDGVRAVCILAVIGDHLRKAAPERFDYFRFGYLGVDMFFVLSGFLIVTLLARERRDRGAINLPAFYARRALRILPLYYLLIGGALLLYVAVSPWAPGGLAFYGPAFPLLFAFLQDLSTWHIGIFNYTWSLAMEEQFYLVWSAIERYCRPATRWAALGALLLVCEASNFGITAGFVDRLYGDPSAHLNALFLCTFAPIALGTLLACLLDGERGHAAARGLLEHPLVVPSGLLAIGLILYRCSDIQGLPRLVIHLAMTCILGSLVMRPDGFWTRALELRVAASLGRASYFVYLFHPHVLAAVFMVLGRLHVPTPPIAIAMLLVVACTWPFALASQAWIEGPLVRLRRRYGSQALPPPGLEVKGT